MEMDLSKLVSHIRMLLACIDAGSLLATPSPLPQPDCKLARRCNSHDQPLGVPIARCSAIRYSSLHPVQ